MKRLLMKKEIEKKTQRNQLLIGFVLIGMMILSTAGYALINEEKGSGNSNNEKVIYNGVNFIQNSGYWQFEKDGSVFITKFNAEETKDLKVLGYLKLADYQSKPLYFVGNNSEAIFELSRNLNEKVLRIQKACLDEKNCEENSPVKTCSDNLIIIKNIDNEDPNPNVYRTNNCVYIVANSTEQVKYSDALLFKILGV